MSFHNKVSNHIILDGTRVKIKATGIFTLFEVQHDGTEHIIDFGNKFNRKIYQCEEIKIQPEKGVTYSVDITAPTELDKTPVETPIESPPTQLSAIKAQLIGEMQFKAQSEHQPTFEEFTDLEMDDGFGDIFGNNMTVYEARSEALRQHYNPFRSFDLDQEGKQDETINEEPTSSTGETPEVIESKGENKE